MGATLLDRLFGSSHFGVWGWCSKRPGDCGQCRGTTTEHRSSPREPHQPKLARNSDTRTLCSTPKRCNSNGAISTFEIHVGELRATFLRNHNMRRHKDPSRRHPKPGRQPKRKTTQAQKTRQPPQPPQARGHCTRYVAVHPLRGGAPVTWRCTRTEEVHCLRIGCSAPTNKNKRGTGTPNHSPPHPSMRTWALLAAGWARRPRHHLHSGPLRPTPTPPTPLNAKSRLFSYPERRNLSRLTVLLRFADAFRPHGHGTCLRCSATASSPNAIHMGMRHARST